MFLSWITAALYAFSGGFEGDARLAGVSVVLYLLATIAVSFEVEDPISHTFAALTSVLIVFSEVVAVLAVESLTPSSLALIQSPEYLLAALCVRGRIVWAWTTLLTYSLAGWLLLPPHLAPPYLFALILPATIVAFGTAWRLLSQRLARRSTILRERESGARDETAGFETRLNALLSDMVTTADASLRTLSRAQREGSSTDVRPVLSRLEAHIRDQICAPQLVAAPLDIAIEEARSRKVDLRIFDSRRVQEPLPAEHLRDLAVRVSQSASGGRVVIRLVPEGRGHLGTYLEESSTSQEMLFF